MKDIAKNSCNTVQCKGAIHKEFVNIGKGKEGGM